VPSTHRAIVANRLLEVLPKSDQRQMLDRCEMVELAFGEILYAPMECLTHVYFPIRSFISLSMRVDATASLEVGLIGSEGMFGIPLALGVDASPVSAAVLGPGSALRMDGELFRRQLECSQALRNEIDRYVFVHLSQLEQATACTRFHVVEARLARWLLMLQDRAHAHTFHITHELLAEMLGVRRVGVTKAASSLQKRHLIHYKRGKITVLDRRGLEAASCGCYKADQESYDRVLGRPLRDEGYRRPALAGRPRPTEVPRSPLRLDERPSLGGHRRT
jgi:CRP-like cAMP-binding protein